MSATARKVASRRCLLRGRSRLAVDPIEDDERRARVAERGAFDQPAGDPLGPGFALGRIEVELGLSVRQAAQRRSDRLTASRTPARVPRDARLELPAPVSILILRFHAATIGPRG